MFTCPPYLTHSFPYRLQHHKVQNWIIFLFFSICSRGTIEFWGPKKPFFKVDMDWGTSNSCSWVSYVHVNKISYPRDVWNLEKDVILHKGVCWNSNTKVVFWHWNRHMENSCIENPNSVHMLWCPLYTWKFFFLKKKQNINFLWNFKVSWINCLWAVLGSFGHIWVDFATMAMADNMTELSAEILKTP
jgi:hypothetical protein